MKPHHNNLGKRITKSPKVYFYDTGFASYLTKNDTKDNFEHSPMTGALYENYIISEIKKTLKHKDEQADLYFYRTSHGVEIDCIIDYITHQTFIEIKYNNSFKLKMLEPMEVIMPEKAKAF